jgi:hypothetical protein
LTFQQVFSYIFDRLAGIAPAFFVYRQDLPAPPRVRARRLVQPPWVLTQGENTIHLRPEGYVLAVLAPRGKEPRFEFVDSFWHTCAHTT